MLILTADNSRRSKQDALSLGAKDFVTKPLDRGGNAAAHLQSAGDALAERRASRPQRHAGREGTGRTHLEEAQLEILQRLALAAEYRDDCTGRHTPRGGTGRTAGTRRAHSRSRRTDPPAAPLHDVGKIGIPDGILLKPEQADAANTPHQGAYRHRPHHPFRQQVPDSSNGGTIALYHHERWDGAGYYRLKGPAIPLEARIVSVVDVFDVITHARPYKAAASIEEAIELIQEEREKQFDPALADAFCELQRQPEFCA